LENSNASLAKNISPKIKIKKFMSQSPAGMTFVIAVLLLIVTFVVRPNSFNINTFGSIILLTILLSFASAGQTLVLIGGGLDFTVGAVMSSAAVITTFLLQGKNDNMLLVLVIVLALGTIVGIINGVACIKIGLPPMIVTMAISNLIAQAQYLFAADGKSLGYAGPLLIKSVSYKIGGVVPAIVFYAILIWGLMFYLLNRSVFGKQLYLVGDSRNAAKLSGIRVNKVILLSYIISGILSAFAGMLGAAYMAVVSAQVFDNYAFQSLIAVIVGGTALSGGIGSYTGSIAGALMMTVLSNGLTALALPEPIKNISYGIIMILLLLAYNRSRAVRQ
jgi:ribose transport system permease protein